VFECSRFQVGAAAEGSDGSFRTSSSGCDAADCSSSSLVERDQQACDDAATGWRHGCHGSGECGGDWYSQRWRQWQHKTMVNSYETNEQQTLV